MRTMMTDRRVRCCSTGAEGVTVRWEPLGAAMCDVLVRESGGRECWYASTDLRALDGYPLPDRRAAQAAARARTAASLRDIRAQHVRDFGQPWPGLEHGKALFGRMLDGAIADLENKV